MADLNVVADGNVKYRDGKKWKTRWCVIKKPSPVADRLQVSLYKDCRDAMKNAQPKSHFPLEGFYGLEAGFAFDKENSVMAIVCQKQVTLLAFESRQMMIQFEVKIRNSLGEEHQFPVQIAKIPLHSRLPLENVRMHIHGQKFCLTSYLPPKLLMSWKICDLRRFGPSDDLFCFEGGSRCGKGTGVHALATEHVNEIDEIIRLSSQGKTPSCRRQNLYKRRSQMSMDMGSHDILFNNKDFQSFHVCGDHNFRMDSPNHPKRHSVSITDCYRSLSNAEKQKLVSIENVAKSRLMSIYDVPPKQVRKVEQKIYFKIENKSPTEVPKSSNSMSTSSLPIAKAFESVGSQIYMEPTKSTRSLPVLETSESTMIISDKALPTPQEKSIIPDEVLPTPQEPTNVDDISDMPIHVAPPIPLPVRDSNVSSQQPAPAIPVREDSAQSCPPREDAVDDVPDYLAPPIPSPPPVPPRTKPPKVESQVMTSDMGAENDREENSDELTSKEDARESLRKQEIDLQREMSLLDEILQGCQMEELGSGRDNVAWKLASKSSKEHHLEAWVKAHCGKDSASVPDDMGSMPSDAGSKRNSTAYSDSVLLSPNLAAKLSKIPPTSKMSAPLHYVNLTRYDTGGVDHVHVLASIAGSGASGISAENTSAGGYDNVFSNKENMYCEVSEVPQIPEKENYYCKPRSINSGSSKPNREPSPPEIPPKGTALQNKNRKRHSLHNCTFCAIHGFECNGLCNNYETPRPGAVALDEADRVTKLRESYLRVGNADLECDMSKQEKKNGVPTDGRLKVKLPLRSKMQSRGNAVAMSGYMDMSGLFDMPPTKLSKSESNNGEQCEPNVALPIKPRPKFFRSLSSKSTEVVPQCILKPSLSADSPMDNSNYMEMSGQTSPRRSVLENLQVLQTYVSTTPSRDKTGSPKCEEDTSQPAVPFPNLLGFQFIGPSNKPQSVCDSNSKNSNKVIPPEQTISVARVTCSNERPASEAISKSSKFLSRIMRRNSRDRKGSQSQENLNLSSQSSLDKIINAKDDPRMSNLKNSRSHSVSQCPTFISSPPPKERQRSSSFPNEMCFRELVANATKKSKKENGENSPCDGYKNQFKPKMSSKPTTSSECYMYMGPMCKENNEQKISEVEERKPLSDPISDNGMFTVLYVQTETDSETRKIPQTDDEKLMQLYKLGKTQHLFNSDKNQEKSLSLDEQAAEIARHVTALPPFIPPKMRQTPCALSPVIESTAFSPRNSKSFADDLNIENIKREDTVVLPSRTFDPTVQKERARATLRIDAPKDLEDETVWIPRSHSGTPESTIIEPSNRPSTGQRVDRSPVMTTKPLDVSEHFDALSISSSESDIFSCCSEDTVRSSPASTILRPRSGKEYQLIERKKFTNRSRGSSPCTPQSPCNTSVFNFEMSASFSGGSTPSKESDPPNSPAPPHEHSYVNVDGTNNVIKMTKPVYVNMDMTPPSSPLQSMPPEQIEPTLNYAEIDLSSPSGSINHRYKNPAVDYAMIDTIATKAAQDASDEHSKTRNSLRRNVRPKFPLHGSKEKKSSSSTKDRKHSSSSVDSG